MMPLPEGAPGLFHNRHRLGVSRAGGRPLLLAGLSVAFANEMQPSFVARMSTQHNIYAGHKMRAQTLASSMRPSEGALAIKNWWSQSAGTRTGTKRKTLEEPPSSRAANEREGEWPEPPDTGNGRGRLTPALRIISGRLDLHGNGRISLDHEPVPSGPRRQVSQIAHSPHRRELHTVVQCDWDAVRNAAKVI